MKKTLTLIIKIAVSGALLYLLFRGMDIDAFLKTIKVIRFQTIIAIAVIFICTQIVSTYRWYTLLKKEMYVPYTRILSIYIVGMFFNNFMPSMVGGDVVKGYYLYKASGKGGTSLASIFMDRYSGFTALMCMSGIAMAIGYSLVSDTVVPVMLMGLIGMFTGISLVIWVEIFHGWAMNALRRLKLFGLNEKIETLYQSVMKYKGIPGTVLKAVALSALVQGGVISSYYLLGAELGMPIPIGYFFLLIPLTTAIAMMPISLAGLGIREGAFVFLFTKFGATQAQAISLSLVWFSITAFISLLGGIEYLRLGNVAAPDMDMPKPGRSVDRLS